MDLIKITTEEKDLVSSYMNDIMSFDSGIIEIIVGWDIAKERGATILNHKIDKNVYWTFSPREKRKIFEENIKSLVFEGIQSLLSEVKTNNLNPLNFENKIEYLNYLKEAVQGCDGYLYSERLYVYCGREIYHIDISLLNFMSWDIINEIKEILNIKEIGKVPEILKNLDIKYIPYLNAKKSNTIGNVH
jgi:hypothetical protein